MDLLKAANPVAVVKGVVGLAGAAAGLAITVAREAVHAPVVVTRGGLHLAGSAVKLAGTVAREAAHVARTGAFQDDVAGSQRAGATGGTDDPRPDDPSAASA